MQSDQVVQRQRDRHGRTRGCEPPGLPSRRLTGHTGLPSRGHVFSSRLARFAYQQRSFSRVATASRNAEHVVDSPVWCLGASSPHKRRYQGKTCPMSEFGQRLAAAEHHADILRG